jgi:CDP-diacylglycerol pyrophosphatase
MLRRPYLSLAVVGAALATALVCFLAPRSATAAAPPDALLKAMQNCVAASKRGAGLPKGCELVSPHGFVVLKEAGKEHLFVPTAVIRGVEDPKVVAPNRPYWLYAWVEAKRYFRTRAVWQIGLAINSKFGRSQNQLHIHMVCMSKKVSDALHHARISSKWSTIVLGGHTYFVKHVTSLAGSQDPFRLVFRKVHSKQHQMQYQTIVVTGAKRGFYILNDCARPGSRGHGEELLDRQCGR